MSSSKDFLRGSEWRIWDFHVHTPASINWKGSPRLTNCNLTTKEDIDVVDTMIRALNDSDAEVFVLMDYFTFDGWFALQNRLEMDNAPTLHKTVFPGIELRLESHKTPRLNAHVVLSNELSVSALHSFLNTLKLNNNNNKPLTKENLIAYARQLPASTVKNYPKDIQDNTESAYKCAHGMAEITFNSWKEAINQTDGLAIPYLAWNTHGGATEFSNDNYQYVFNLMQFANIFEVKSESDVQLFSNIQTDQNKSFLDEFQYCLGNNPCLAVRGSDAHRFISSGAERGYADFPSNKKTWIKADTTFEGLLQAIKEPANRSFIGSKPPKLVLVEQNPEHFIDSITISNNTDPISWFKPATYPLNKDLIAIIGNKGSGKSALIDCVAHVIENKTGYTHDNFVKKFENNNAKESIQFKVEFLNNSFTRVSYLKKNENSSDVITYLPQGYFDDLCNKSSSKEFQNIINDIIFSYIDEGKRLSKDNYDDLINLHDSTINQEILEIKKEIGDLNEKYTKNIDILSTDVEELNQSLDYLKSRKNEMRLVINEQSTKLSEYQQENKLLEEVNKLQNEIQEIERKLEINREAYKSVVIKKDLLVKAIEELNFIKEKHQNEIQNIANKYFIDTDIEIADIYSFSIKIEMIEVKIEELELEIQKIIELGNSLNSDLEENKKNLINKNQQLSTTNKTIHDINESIVNAQKNFEIDENKINELENKKLIISKAKDEQITLANERKDKLEKLHQIGNEKIKHREEMFEGINNQIKELIEKDKIDISLNFEVIFYFDYEAFEEELKNYIYLRKNILNTTNIRKTINSCFDDNGRIECFNDFADNFIKKLEEESNPSLAEILKDSDKLQHFYNFMYSSSFIKVKNIIQFKKTDIDILSPGQRGELLIVLFLLLDKSNKPILIDQPEENLDNQTIFNTLVPIIKKAKERRQVLMVTHNPNLAVVCDAEQIIYASFDRQNNNQISYELGSVENNDMKKHIVDVLEGTQPAFINRQRKYGLT